MTSEELEQELRGNFGMMRGPVIAALTSIESPTTPTGVVDAIFKDITAAVECGCMRCTAEGVGAAVTLVVLEELLKMVPAASENGVAALIHKLYVDASSRVRVVSDFSANEGSAPITREDLVSLIRGITQEAPSHTPPDTEED